MDDSAAKVIAEILEKDDWTSRDHLALLSQLFTVKDAPTKFCEMLADLEANNPDPSGPAALKVGMLRYSLCRFSEALEALESADNNGEKHYFTGLCHSAMKHYDKAAASFEQAVQKGFDEASASVRLVEAMLMNGQMDEAKKSLKSIEKKLAGSADVLYLNGLIAELEGELDRAVESYEGAREIRPGHAESTFHLAYTLDLHGEEEEALELYMECLEHPPMYASVLLNMAVIYEDLGQYDDAIACLRRVLACNPNHWRAKLFLRDAISSTEMYYDEDKARRIAKRNAILDISVTDFELSVRARNCLKKMNIFTLGDLVRTTEAELLTYKNFGETSLKEIKEMLSMKGLSLGQALEENSQLFSTSSTDTDTEGDQKEVGVRAIPIDKLELSIRSQRVLENLNIMTLGQLADRTEAELTCQKNFGKTSLLEIREVLAQHDLALRTVK